MINRRQYQDNKNLIISDFVTFQTAREVSRECLARLTFLLNIGLKVNLN